MTLNIHTVSFSSSRGSNLGVRTAPSTGEVPPIQTAGEGAVLPTETAAD